jgi:hypothetical protein
MLEIKRFRVDTLKLSTESMPVAEADGTTCYEVDTGKFYIYYKGQWYEQGAEETTANDTKETENNSKILEEPLIDIKEEPIEPIIEEPLEK